MSDSRTIGNDLLTWYASSARPFLEQHAPNDLAAIDQQALRVEPVANATDEEVAVAFLGAAGVGKSTLLNSLVDPRYNVLPHGGVGPLTAQATVVRHAEKPYFRAAYFSAPVFRGILLALERAHERALARAPEAGGSDDVAATLDDEERQEAEAALPLTGEDVPTDGQSEKIDTLQRQVKLLVKAEQQGDVDLPYLLDALRLALGFRPRWGRTLTAEDAARVERVRACFELAKREGAHRERHAEGDLAPFLLELRDHASGFLAPMIKSLEVGWSAEGLADGLVLVDLPGVGVANDKHALVTASWIREKARAIILVVDRAGVTEASASLLRTSGFLNRLMYDSHDPGADPVTLAVVVVKVDQSAHSAWQDDKALNPGASRKWGDHFKDTCDRTIDLVKGQMQQELEKLASAGPQETREERKQALSRVLDTLQVHPVSAPQFRLFNLQDDEDMPRIKSADESRIPQLLAALRSLADDHRERCRQRTRQILADFGNHVRTSLNLVQANWEQDARAEKEAQLLREELEIFLKPKQRELDMRRSAFREFLRNGVPTQIEEKVATSTLVARQDMAKYLKKLSELHWATLKAIVRKGGAHVSSSGKHIDLPNELALRFEEPVAVVWSKGTLVSLRKRTKELGDDYVQVVGEVVDWARGQEARVQPRLVEAMHENLLAQTKDLSTVGKEAVDDLKKRVRTQLYDKLVKRVRRRCETFVDAKQSEGPGVKRRILELFHDELAGAVVEIAGPIANSVLLENYNLVQNEIEGRFAAYRNPLDSARDAIVQSHEDGVRRSDAQKRRRVLEQVSSIVAGMPGAHS